LLNLLSNRKKLLSNREKLGRWGEKKAEKALLKKGLKTLTRNYSCKTGEIDLVMVDRDSIIVFIEVKTRTSELLAPAESAVTPQKKQKSLRTARYFLKTYNLESRPCRFDVVTTLLTKKGPPTIKHYENAFSP